MGNDNGVYYGKGFRIDSSDSRSIGNMQKNATAESLVNYDGDPEGNVSANPGSAVFDRTNGVLYMKKTGTGNTGWERIQSGGTVATTYQEDSGTATPSGNILNILGGTGANTVGTGSTVRIHADGAGQVNAINLGLTYDSGTATIKGADGNDLSATNPAYVTLPSNVTDGLYITTAITENVSFDDSAGSSSIFAGSLFGFDTGDVTTDVVGTADSGVKFFLGAVLDSSDENPIFIVTPVWHTNTASKIKDAGSGNADAYSDILSTTSITVGNYENNTFRIFATFIADKTAGDDWTITDVTNGTNNFDPKLNFLGTPLGAQGAASSSLFLANGGTAPTITSGRALYADFPIWRTYELQYNFTIGGSPAGAVDAQLVLPPKVSSGTEFSFFGMYETGGNFFQYVFKRVSPPASNNYLEIYKADGTGAKLQYNEMSSGDKIWLTGRMGY